MDGAPATVALEVEMTYKSSSEYPQMAQFYSVERELLRVVWLVRYRGIAKEILKAVGEVGGVGKDLHDFILLEDFLKSGWNSRFFAGRDIGIPLARLLPTVSEISQRRVASTLLLNSLKSPHRSPDYANLKKSFKSHRVGLSLLAPLPSSRSSNTPSKGVPTNEN